MFTILLPVFNGERWIIEAIQNLKDQVYTDFEVIIVCNGCTDRSASFAASQIAEDERFRLVDTKFANKSSALNIGVMMASREWIAIYDVDDRWHIEKLDYQAREILSTSSLEVLGTQMFYLTEDNEVQPEGPLLPLSHEDIMSCLLERKSNPFCNSSITYRRDLHFTRVGFYDPQCAVEDYDFWIRCALVGAHFKNLAGFLAFHRLHSGSHFNGSNKQRNDKIFLDSMMEHRRKGAE